MCDCAVGWLKDPNVSGPHSKQKISCETYIAQLERAVSILDESGLVLPRLRQLNGVQRDYVGEADRKMVDRISRLVDETLAPLKKFMDEVMVELTKKKPPIREDRGLPPEIKYPD